MTATPQDPRTPDWPKAYAYLQEVRVRYANLGSVGVLGLRIGLDPLLLRYERGERSRELYDEIMESE